MMPPGKKAVEMPVTMAVPIEHKGMGVGKRWLIRIAVILIILFLFWTWIGSIFGEKIPDVSDGSVLVMSNYGRVVEYNRNKLPLPFLHTHNDTLLDMMYSLKKASVDDRIRGVVIKFGFFDVGIAQAQDIRDEILLYKKSGKKIYAFASAYSMLDYYMASACDKVYLMPQGMIDMRGVLLSKTFYKGLMDKLGIKAEFVRIENYKTAPTVYTEYEMTTFDREQRGLILDTYIEVITSSIAASRGIQKPSVLNMLDSGILFGKTAKKEKLIDDNLYLDQVIDLFKNKDEKEQIVVNDKDYRRIPAEEVGLNEGPAIAIVYACGAITDGEDSVDFQSGETIGGDTLAEQLYEAKRDSRIKAVILRVDSPGGSGTASEVILRAVEELKEAGKPVIVSMGNVAASGGYYISCLADKIVAQPTTITGSIGIFAGKFDMSGFYSKIGIKKDILKRGKYSDIFTETRPATKDEITLVYNVINDFYQGFLAHVAKGRSKTTDEIDKIGRGRVWSGADAKKVGLVDELGGFNTAVDIAKKMAHIEPEEKISIILFPKRKSFFQILFGGKGDETVKYSSDMVYARLLPNELRETIGLLGLFNGSRNYKIYALMPYMLHFE
jgi:protease-4